MKIFYNVVKGIYDILATYLLIVILPFALAAYGIHLGLDAVAVMLEYQRIEDLWAWFDERIGLGATVLRIVVVLPVHALIFVVLRRPAKWAQPHIERAFDKVVGVFRKFTDRFPWIQEAGEIVFSLTVTALLVPFVIQPTLVYGYGATSWLERTANLLDGSATAAIADSVVGLYRRIYAEPVVAEGVSATAVDDAIDTIEQTDQTEVDGPLPPPIPTGKQPLMDRWDPYIARAVDNDRTMFAMVKAFMYVESAGRQYAVSHTGCAGLMQFCAGTARSSPFKQIFGTGQIYVCGCHKKDCSIPRDVQKDLESGDPKAIDRQKDRFPCELTDARFNPHKIIGAGTVYVRNLSNAYGGNIYLMYIGYNSGPGVANRVYKKLGQKPEATLEEIEVHLADAMRPTYKQGSERRARSLVRTHLPKIKRAFDRYYAAGVPGGEEPEVKVQESKDPPAADAGGSSRDAGYDVGADAAD